AAGPGRGAMAHGGRQRGGWTDQCSETDPGAVQPARDGRVRHSYPYRSAPQARPLAASRRLIPRRSTPQASGFDRGDFKDDSDALNDLRIWAFRAFELIV